MKRRLQSRYSNKFQNTDVDYQAYDIEMIVTANAAGLIGQTIADSGLKRLAGIEHVDVERIGNGIIIDFNSSSCPTISFPFPLKSIKYSLNIH